MCVFYLQYIKHNWQTHTESMLYVLIKDAELLLFNQFDTVPPE